MPGARKTIDKYTDSTRASLLGRNDETNCSTINTPVYHASTILYSNAGSLENRTQKYNYGLRGTPTTDSLENAICELEGGYRTRLTPSGLSAITTAILSFVKTGDHILVSDSAYEPTRIFCDGLLRHLGVETEYYDPRIGAGIEKLLRSNTRLVFTESPGSETLEIQDIPAISQAVKKHGVLVFTDNTWASPLYFKPFAHGVDISIQAVTKYIVGHSDVLMGSITANEACWRQMYDGHYAMGQSAGPDDIYMALRGMRTIDVRLERHMKQGIEIAKWLEDRPEVDHVLHPALPSHPDHSIWKRDFLGASGLFSAVFKPCSKDALHAFLDSLVLFGMGYSWGGYASLVIPFDPRERRSATQWRTTGPALRFHIGLEGVEDLKRDLVKGFETLAETQSR